MKLFLFKTLQETLLLPSQPCNHCWFLLARLTDCPRRLSSQPSAAGTDWDFSSSPLQEIIFFFFSKIVKTFLHRKIRNCHLNSFDKPSLAHPSILNETKGKGNMFFCCFGTISHGTVLVTV